MYILDLRSILDLEAYEQVEANHSVHSYLL